MREPKSLTCKWRQVFSKHTTNRPKDQPHPLVSIASCCERRRDPTLSLPCSFTIDARNAFFPEDGVAWRVMARANSHMEAEEGCCLHGLALLVLLDAPNVRLLDKDWVGGARAVAQKGHDMMHTWLFHEAGKLQVEGSAYRYDFYEAMASPEMHVAGRATQVTPQNPTTPCQTNSRAKRAYVHPPEGEAHCDDERIRVLVCGFLDRWRAYGNEGPLKMNEAPGGRTYGPQLSTLLPPGGTSRMA